MFKTLPYFFFIALIPSVVMGLFGSPISHFLFFYGFASKPIEAMPGGFTRILREMFGMFDNGWILVAELFLLLLFSSLLFGIVGRHLRSGRFGIKHPFSRINDSLPAVLPIIIAIVIIQILFALVSSGIVTLSHYLFSSFGNPPTIFSWTVSIILIVALQLVIIDIYSMCLLIPPVYTIVGYPYRSSASYATKLRHKDSFKIFFACLWPYLVMFTFGLIGKVIGFYTIPVNILCYTYLFLYFVSLAMTSYYELSGTERMDYKRKLGKAAK